jgi:heat shock protein HtpX
VVVGNSCPKCGTALASIRKAAPWCPQCEFNLDRMPESRRGPFGPRFVDRRIFRLAYRWTAAEFRALEGRSEIPSGRLRLPGLVVVVASVLISLFTVAAVVVGVWLCTLSFPGIPLLPGVVLILLAVEMRPRFGRLPKGEEPNESPSLQALVSHLAKTIGAPVPDAVYLSEDMFNAYTGQVGLRRRRVLVIGLPL